MDVKVFDSAVLVFNSVNACMLIITLNEMKTKYSEKFQCWRCHAPAEPVEKSLGNINRIGES